MYETKTGMETVLHTIEAEIDERGNVQLLTPIHLSARHRALVTILENEQAFTALRPFGLCAGEFVVPDNFDEPLPHEIVKAFEGE